LNRIKLATPVDAGAVCYYTTNTTTTELIIITVMILDGVLQAALAKLHSIESLGRKLLLSQLLHEI